MPFQSKSQLRLMFAAAKGDIPSISKKIAKKFIEHSKGQKTKDLPEKKDKFHSLKKVLGKNRG